METVPVTRIFLPTNSSRRDLEKSPFSPKSSSYVFVTFSTPSAGLVAWLRGDGFVTQYLLHWGKSVEYFSQSCPEEISFWQRPCWLWLPRYISWGMEVVNLPQKVSTPTGRHVRPEMVRLPCCLPVSAPQAAMARSHLPRAWWRNRKARPQLPRLRLHPFSLPPNRPPLHPALPLFHLLPRPGVLRTCPRASSLRRR